MPEKQLQSIEWHDARLERLELHPGGLLKVFFKHLCSYHQLDAGKVEVWSSRALLVLKEVTSFQVDNIISDSYIDGDLLDAEGNEVPLLPLHTEKPVSLFKIFVAGAGTHIEISAKSAVLEMLEPLEKLEDMED